MRRYNINITGSMQVLSCTDAFDCTERDMVISEIQKVKKWKQGGRDIVGIKAGDDNMLLKALTQVRCFYEPPIDLFRS